MAVNNHGHFTYTYILINKTFKLLSTDLNVFKCFPFMMSGISEEDKTQDDGVFSDTECMHVCVYSMYLYVEDSPNPMPSYCARSRSTVCLMTVSLAPWRRPCRPLIPFISSICSSSESNLWRYLRTHKETHKR